MLYFLSRISNKSMSIFPLIFFYCNQISNKYSEIQNAKQQVLPLFLLICRNHLEYEECSACC